MLPSTTSGEIVRFESISPNRYTFDQFLNLDQKPKELSQIILTKGSSKFPNYTDQGQRTAFFDRSAYLLLSSTPVSPRSTQLKSLERVEEMTQIDYKALGSAEKKPQVCFLRSIEQASNILCAVISRETSAIDSLLKVQDVASS